MNHVGLCSIFFSLFTSHNSRWRIFFPDVVTYTMLFIKSAFSNKLFLHFSLLLSTLTVREFSQRYRLGYNIERLKFKLARAKRSIKCSRVSN